MIKPCLIAALKAQSGPNWEDLRIAALRIGPHLTAVSLSNGGVGVASTSIGYGSASKGEEGRHFGAFSPLHMRGRFLGDLLETPAGFILLEGVKLAALNALSSTMLSDDSAHKVLPDTDPVDLIPAKHPLKIVIVGAFTSYIRKLLPIHPDLRVLEFNRENLNPEHHHLFVPTEKASAFIPSAHVVVLTGMTLLNETLDGLLELTTDGQQIIVTGPSASILPSVLFERGVDIIGATRVTNPRRLFELVQEGGSGYHLFRYCARKITLVRR